MPFLFDGNNLIGQSAEQARRKPAVRQAMLEALSRHAAAGGGKFTVFFDGDDPDRRMPPRGVRVRYSAPLSSDDAILQMIEATKSPADFIVVTNDRELAARCRVAGAKTMDWRQFTSRMERRLSRPTIQGHSEEKVDVVEWSRYLGIDPEAE